ncbi:MAG: hypothetical protein ICV74_03185 [Thermoleophilia bacterium]|nr:hypothetical protein [Thermoleophilia bacterium]
MPLVAPLALAAPGALVVARLLPDDGAGLALRLAAASLCVLVLPGALVLRLLGWPRDPALALTASLALSLGLVFVAYAVTFALDRTLGVAVGVLAAAALVALFLPFRARAEPSRAGRDERLAFFAVALAGVAFGALLWWATDAIKTGDALFHLARARKLAEAHVLTSVGVANEYKDGGLHPGYAFPLWHGVMALIARLAGVDVALVFLHVASVLSPLAFVVAYAAGAAIFRSWAGGVALAAAQVAQLAFSRGAVGSFGGLALPASATRVLLVPAVLALVFAYLREPRRPLLLALACAALAVAAVHPTYLVFLAIALAAFAVVSIAAARERVAVARSLAAPAAALLLPAVLFFLWLLPVVTSTASHTPSKREEARALAHYGNQLEHVEGGYRAAPEAVTRGGPVVVAGLAVVPLLALAATTPWGAYAAGATLALLAILLVPDMFMPFSDLVSISQSRRLAQFLPIPVAVAGAALVLGHAGLGRRAHVAGAAGALAAGVALARLYPAETSHVVERGGPVWPLWVAVAGGSIGLALAVLRRRPILLPVRACAWGAAAALAFVTPIVVAGIVDLQRVGGRDEYALSPGLTRALRRLPQESVVFAPVDTSYRVAAFAPVYVAATPPPNAADTAANRPYERQRDVLRFFAGGSRPGTAARRKLLRRNHADYLLVDKRRSYPRAVTRALVPVYADGRYALFRITPR